MTKRFPKARYDESPGALRAFHDYCKLGAHRTYEKLYQHYVTMVAQRAADPDFVQPPTLKFTTIRLWYSIYEWKRRADEWDKEQIGLEQAEWEARQRELRQKDWAMGEEMRKLFWQIMETAPKFVKQKRQFIPGTNGNPDREIITLALDEAMIIKLAAAAHELQRSAAGVSKTYQFRGANGQTAQIEAYDYNKAIAALAPASDEEEEDETIIDVEADK